MAWKNRIALGLAAKSVGTFVTRIAIVLVRLVLGVLTARLLGPEGKGSLYLLVTSIMMCATLGNLGIGPASIYFIGRDRSCLPKIVGNIYVLAGAVGLGTVVLTWAVLQYSRLEIYTLTPFWMWLIATFLVPTYLLRSLLMQVLSAVLRIKEVNLVEVAAISLQVPLLVLLVIMLDGGIGGAFVAYACSEVFGAIAFWLFIVRHVRPAKRPDLTLLKKSLRFGVKSYISNLMRQLNLRLGVFLLTAFAIEGIPAIGVYSVATSIAELLLFVPQSIRLSLFPMVAASSTEEANRLTSEANRHTIFLTTACGVAIAILAPFAVPTLYGNDFRGAIGPMYILIPGAVLLSQAHIFYGDLTGRGKPEATAVSGLLSLLVTAALGLFLIPEFGILGAAIASACAYTVEFAVAGAFFILYSGLRWQDALVIRRSDFRHYTWGRLSKMTKATSIN